MRSAIHPEAAAPAGRQAFEQSDRTPEVSTWGEEGGQVARPPASASRVTSVPSSAGLMNYGTGGSADAVEDEGEREG